MSAADVFDLTYTDVGARMGVTFAADATPTSTQVTTEITRVAAAVATAVTATGRSPGTYISTATGQELRTYYVLQNVVLLGVVARVLKATSPAEVDKHKEADDEYKAALDGVRNDDPAVYGSRRVSVRSHVTDNVDELDAAKDYGPSVKYTDTDW